MNKTIMLLNVSQKNEFSKYIKQFKLKEKTDKLYIVEHKGELYDLARVTTLINTFPTDTKIIKMIQWKMVKSESMDPIYKGCKTPNDIQSIWDFKRDFGLLIHKEFERVVQVNTYEYLEEKQIAWRIMNIADEMIALVWWIYSFRDRYSVIAVETPIYDINELIGGTPDLLLHDTSNGDIVIVDLKTVPLEKFSKKTSGSFAKQLESYSQILTNNKVFPGRLIRGIVVNVHIHAKRVSMFKRVNDKWKSIDKM